MLDPPAGEPLVECDQEHRLFQRLRVGERHDPSKISDCVILRYFNQNPKFTLSRR